MTLKTGNGRGRTAAILPIMGTEDARGPVRGDPFVPAFLVRWTQLGLYREKVIAFTEGSEGARGHTGYIFLVRDA
jgi:hypothetical protein